MPITINEFDTQYSRSFKPKTESGSGEKTTFKPKVSSTGVIQLVASGKVNLYDEIQSHADSVDIHVILKRYAAGDESALAQRIGSYGDFSHVPTTFAGVLNSVINAQEIFNSLPIEVKNNFGNSFEQFYASMDQPDFAQRFAIKPVLSDRAQSAVAAPGASVVPNSGEALKIDNPSGTVNVTTINDDANNVLGKIKDLLTSPI